MNPPLGLTLWARGNSANLPAWMQVISNILPLTRGIAAARALAAGASLGEVSPLLSSEIGIGLVYGVLGYFLFAWFETQAKKKGTLETV